MEILGNFGKHEISSERPPAGLQPTEASITPCTLPHSSLFWLKQPKQGANQGFILNQLAFWED